MAFALLLLVILIFLKLYCALSQLGYIYRKRGAVCHVLKSEVVGKPYSENMKVAAHAIREGAIMPSP